MNSVILRFMRLSKTRSTALAVVFAIILLSSGMGRAEIVQSGAPETTPVLQWLMANKKPIPFKLENETEICLERKSKSSLVNDSRVLKMVQVPERYKIKAEN